jgi:hypothetical protein
MTTTAIVPAKPLTSDDWRMISEIAPVMYKSRLFGVSSIEQAIAVMLKGHELGFPLTMSYEVIKVIQGQPSLAPRGALALVLVSGQLEAWKIEEPVGSCSVWMKRVNGLEYSLTWTMDDAKRAGVVKPGSGWETYPANMLKWRVIGFVLDVLFPDVIGGMKRADEFGASIDSNGNVIDAQWTEQRALPHTEPAPNPLNILVEKYGPEAVMAAAGNTIPQTEDEIKAVALKLETEQEETEGEQ